MAPTSLNPLVVSRDAHRDIRARTIFVLCYVHFSLTWIPNSAILIYLLYKGHTPDLYGALLGCHLLAPIYIGLFFLTRGRHTHPVWLTILAISILSGATLVVSAMLWRYLLLLYPPQTALALDLLPSRCVMFGFTLSGLYGLFLLYIVVYTLLYHGKAGFLRPFASPVAKPRLATLPGPARRDAFARIARIIIFGWTVLFCVWTIVLISLVLAMAGEAAKNEPRYPELLANFTTCIVLVCYLCAMFFLASRRSESIFSQVWVEMGFLTCFLVAILVTALRISQIEGDAIVMGFTGFPIAAMIIIALLFEGIYTTVVHRRSGWTRPFAASSFHEREVIELTMVFKRADRKQKVMDEENNNLEEQVNPFLVEEEVTMSNSHPDRGCQETKFEVLRGVTRETGSSSSGPSYALLSSHSRSSDSTSVPTEDSSWLGQQGTPVFNEPPYPAARDPGVDGEGSRAPQYELPALPLYQVMAFAEEKKTNAYSDSQQSLITHEKHSLR